MRRARFDEKRGLMTEGQLGGDAGQTEGRRDAGRLRPSADAVAKRVDEEVILVQLRTNRIYTLNRTGARLWELLESGHDLEQAQAQMLLEFDVGEGKLADEVRALVDDLVANGLLEHDASS